MSDDRRTVLGRVRTALAARTDRAPAPEYPDDIATSRAASSIAPPADVFAERLAQTGGVAFRDPRALAGWLVERGHLEGYCDPAIADQFRRELSPPLRLHDRFSRGEIESYAFAITRAVGAIAETGTVILDDKTTTRRLATVAPWVHVAVVPTSAIHVTIAQALAALGDEPYVAWCTGPSRTADIEGILIVGVHGPGEQLALIV